MDGMGWDGACASIVLVEYFIQLFMSPLPVNYRKVICIIIIHDIFWHDGCDQDNSTLHGIAHRQHRQILGRSFRCVFEKYHALVLQPSRIKGDIGHYTDPKEEPLVHCVRLLAASFLLTGQKNGEMGEPLEMTSESSQSCLDYLHLN